MNPTPEFAHLFQLPLAERLQLVEDLWDSIAAEQDALPLPQWQVDEVNARLARFDAGENQLVSWDEAVAHARARSCAK
jgi:putative addiction module component (TIGR02574 family)